MSKGIGDQAFYDCDSLESIVIPASVTSIGAYAFKSCNSLTLAEIHGKTAVGYASFSDCEKLKKVLLGDDVTSIYGDAFAGCASLQSIDIPDSVTGISQDAFYNCDSLVSATIGSGVKEIGDQAFYDCDNLVTVTFCGNAPSFGDYAFGDVTAICYYPAGNATWTEAVRQDYGGSITWVAYAAKTAAVTEMKAPTVAVETVTSSAEEEIRQESETNEAPTFNAVYGGEYGTQTDGEYVKKTASFTGLVPGQPYVLLALESIDMQDVLKPDNLLYIAQEAAGEDGTLEFVYVQREAREVSFVMACGASHQNLEDAQITFPMMIQEEESRAVAPEVVYDGEVLTEGVDYVITGTADYTAAGEYTCYIRGIRDYTGIVTCVYTVEDVLRGDMNGDAQVTDADAVYLLRHTLFPEDFAVSQPGDINGDGQVTDADAVYLLRHTLFPEDFPI